MSETETDRLVALVFAQETERLLACVSFTPSGGFDYAALSFVALRGEVNAGNQTWLAARVAEALYARGAIHDERFDHVMRAIG